MIAVKGKKKSRRELTDKLNRLVEPGADVGFVVVLHRDALVEVRVLKMVGAVGGDIDESGDPQHVQHVFSGSMVRTSKVEERQDFNRTTLREGKKNNKHLAKVQKKNNSHVIILNKCTDLVI